MPLSKRFDIDLFMVTLNRKGLDRFLFTREHLILTDLAGVYLDFGKARLAPWYQYHKPIASMARARVNPAFGIRYPADR